MKDIIRFTLERMKPHRRTIAVSAFLAVVAAGIDVAVPVVMGRAFDAAANRASVLVFGGILFLWFVGRIFAEAIRGYISYKGDVTSQAISRGYLSEAMSRLLRKNLGFHYGKQSGESSEKLSNFRWELQGAISGIGFDVIPSMLALLAILSYLLYLDWRIASVLLASIIGYVVYTYRIIEPTITSQAAWQSADRKTNATAWDALRNILVVKSTGNEQAVDADIIKNSKIALQQIEKDSRHDFRVQMAQQSIIAVGSFAAVFFAAANLASGRFTLGQLTVIVAYAFSIFGYVRYVQWQFRVIVKLTANYRTVQELLAEPAEDYESGRRDEIKGGVEFRSVKFGYSGKLPVLEDVSFTASAGQRVAIVGESGQGKTTLVDLFGRYYEPQSGTILFDGRDAKEINLASLRSQMAYVPQDLTLFHESLGYNIRFGRPDASDADVALAAKRAHLEEFIAGLPEGLATVVGERGLKLSGGERQRVALARAFLRDPKILVLDEPTAHLDSKTEAAIQAALAELMKGRTTFIIAHRLRTVQDADLILVLKDGRIAEQGTHAELAAIGGAYASLLRAQGGYITPDEQHLS